MRLESAKERERNHKSRSNLRARESERSKRRDEIPVMRRRHGKDDRPADGGGVASSLVIKIKEKRKGWPAVRKKPELFKKKKKNCVDKITNSMTNKQCLTI